MLSKGFLKAEISINLIGKQRFLIGVVIGFLFSLTISYFLNYSREALRMLTFFRDPYILSSHDFRLYDLFFAFFLSSLGFGITLIVWLYGRNRFSKRHYRKLYAMTYTWFIVFASFMILTRMGSLISFVLYANFGYSVHLDFLKDFRLLLVLIPIFIFFSQWNAIRLIIRFKYWTWILFGSFLVVSLYLFQTTRVDRDVLNFPYYYKNKDRFDYIDNELFKIQRFGFELSPDTKEILRKKHADETFELVHNLKSSFSNSKIVPIDTLILEKIVIHNLNHHRYYFYMKRGFLDENWAYALPEDVYCQILKHDINSPETQLLFEILNEQIKILGFKEIDWEQRKLLDKEESQRYFENWMILRSTESIQSRMIQVIQKLKSDKKYEQYYYLIPDIEFLGE